MQWCYFILVSFYFLLSLFLFSFIDIYSRLCTRALVNNRVFPDRTSSELANNAEYNDRPQSTRM